MSISIITAATSEPLSLTDVKEFLRVDHADDDVTLAIMISAARELCEQYTRQILMTTTIEEFYDTFPDYTPADKDIIYLSRGPVQSVSSVKYVDDAGDEITIASNKYRTDLISQPSRIISEDGWFSTKDTTNAVIVEYVVGFSSASDVPAPLRQGILLVVADMYENRMDSVKRLPTASEYLWNPFRVFTF
jgi:uncharacterized phiE125 gp8 family phage protein